MSGLPSHPVLFYGFLPAKSAKQISILETLRKEPYTLIFYESPHRVFKTLESILTVFGDRNVVIARELTKKFEEIIQGRVSELLQLDPIKGEIVLLVEGYIDTSDASTDLLDEVYNLIEQGVSSKEAIKVIAKRHNLPKNEVYQRYHNK
jgi:16S rRNA (cytidine1402-2'-O)-methyltransferase